MLNEEIIRHGREVTVDRRELRAGPLAMLYQDGDLRYISLGGREIVRRIYVAVRDRYWRTIPGEISNLSFQTGDSSFTISFTMTHKEGEIVFVWQGKISGDGEGTVIYSMDGEALSTFWRNRIGICILHPAGCAGLSCFVEHVDGSREEGQFPLYISPHQPFVDMRAIGYRAAPEISAEVRFEGDTFEMEDQRNWTDASFKTYSTPLALPIPAPVRHGDRVSQRVTLSLLGWEKAAKPTVFRAATTAGDGTPLALAVGDAPLGPLPRLGLGLASHGGPLSAREVERLRALNLSHLRVNLSLGDNGWCDTLIQAARQASALGVALEVALFLAGNPETELAALRAVAGELGADICSWLVFREGESCTTGEWVEMSRRYLGDYDRTAKIVSGTNGYFTELNRGQPPLPSLDAICYSLNPQVHAFDDTSLMETLPTQAWMVASARRLARGLPVVVSPVALRPRFNPHMAAAGVRQVNGDNDLPFAVDPRQMSLFAAAWTVGSLQYLAQSGAHSITYYETTGWRGVMERESGSPLPEQFPSIAGCVFPLYHVLASAGEVAGGLVLPLAVSDSLKAAGLAIDKDGGKRLLIANLTSERQTIHVEGLGAPVRACYLDERNAESAMREPEKFRAAPGELLEDEVVLELLPYAVACLDTWELWDEEV